MTSARARRSGALLLAAVVTGLVVLAAVPGGAQDRSVLVTEVRGIITPVIAEHLTAAVQRAAAEDHEALVIELDTPGGLVTAMRDIVRELLNAPVPVVVHVTPSGADAASAGTFITMAAHVAAMAPATTIGAATPVSLQGGQAAEQVGDKVVNNAAAYAEAVAAARDRDVDFAVAAVREGRAITAEEAEASGVVDLLAPDLPALLAALDGRSVRVDGQPVVLRTAGATTVSMDMTLVRRIQQVLANPELAFLFLSLGTLAIVYELANPGLQAGGILGAVLLILAMFSLSVLPINFAGVALIALAAILFLVELFAPGLGVAAAGGSVALVLGGLLLVEEPSGLGLDWTVVVPTGAVLFVLVVVAGRLVVRGRQAPSRAASDVLIGRSATVTDVDGTRGRIRLDGTWWRARDADGAPLHDDQAVEVVDRRNLDLLVRPVSDDDADPSDQPDPPSADADITEESS